MTSAATADLLHHLVTGTHAEGITALAVQAAIHHDTRVLLLADHGADFIDDTWQLPGATVLPGQTLTDALHPVAAAIGMSIDEVTGYLGHHDHTGTETTRTFCFTVTVTDPDAICRSAIRGHHWACLDDLPRPLSPAARWLAEPAATTPAAKEPPLSGPLRTWASGIYPDEAGVELLIDHAALLHRSDFTDRFVVPRASNAGDQTTASLDWSAAITALDAGDLPCSRSEERVLRLAASLGNGLPVNLRDTTTGLDAHNAALLSRAILHAAGHRPVSQTH